MESSDTFDIREHAWSVKIKTSQFYENTQKNSPDHVTELFTHW